MLSMRFARTGLLSLAASGLLMAATPASAQELLRPILGLIGITSDDKEPIEYRERAPLVVPPKHVLRAPGEAEALRNNQRWPVDPDAEAKKNKREASRKPDFTLHSDPNPRSSIDEIRAGRIPGAGVPRQPDFGDRFLRDSGADLRLTPQEMRAISIQNQEPALAYGQEPARRYITEPPKGYRTPASGAPIQATKQSGPVDDKMAPNIREWQQQQVRRN